MNQKELYFSTGSLYIKYTEDQDGNKQGKYVKYFPNGEIEESSTYKDDKLHGECKKYKLVDKLVSNRPILVSSSSYTLGKLDGLRQVWCETTGKPLVISNYNYGVLDGEHTEWYPNGNLHKKHIYKNGKLMPGSKTWFEDGTLLSIFDDDTDTIYDRNGKLSSICKYDEDYNLIHVTNYYPSGNKRAECSLQNGKKHKTILYANEIIDYNVVSVSKTFDYSARTITIVTPVKECNMREIYTFGFRLLKREYVDYDGNAIPSVFCRIKAYLSNFFVILSKEEIIKTTEEIELLNEKLD